MLSAIGAIASGVSAAANDARRSPPGSNDNAQKSAAAAVRQTANFAYALAGRGESLGIAKGDSAYASHDKLHIAAADANINRVKSRSPKLNMHKIANKRTICELYAMKSV